MPHPTSPRARAAISTGFFSLTFAWLFGVFWAVPNAALASSDWLRQVQSDLETREYHVSHNDQGLQAPNRAHHLRIYFQPGGVRVHDRGAASLLLGMGLAAYGRGDQRQSVAPVAPKADKNRVSYAHPDLREWYLNGPEGLEQGFDVPRAPFADANGAFWLELAFTGIQRAESRGADVQLRTEQGRVLSLAKLIADDAEGKRLPGRMEVVAENRVRLWVDDREAVYPIVIDPILGATEAATLLEPNQVDAKFGVQVAGAGDVNNDGYDDVIVGALGYDNGETDEGAAFVYHGSASGIATSYATMVESNQANARLGYRVAGAGDVNGDGYADVIVGADAYANGESGEGAAFVYHGSASGISTSYATKLESNQVNAHLGQSVAGAGDVNGDGYADVIVGAPDYDHGEMDEGAAFVYHGSAGGVATAYTTLLEADQTSAHLGFSVAGAGDVDNDGHADVIVGAYAYANGEPGEGAAFVFHGSSGGVASGYTTLLESNQTGASLGQSVAGAGDVNNDGFADVIVGAPGYANGESGEGAAFVYHGSAGGISTSYATLLESNQVNANLGRGVAGAGDVNNDGYADVVVGAYTYANGESGEGVAFVHHGAAGGISTSYATLLESNQANARLGDSVAGAGDVNNDGYADVVVGSVYYDHGEADEGAAFVYLGTSKGICIANPMVSSAADSGPGTLRQAILSACPGTTIGFDGDYTIRLASMLTVDKNLTIDGGVKNIVISGDTTGDGTRDVQVFLVTNAATATFAHLSIQDGKNTNGGDGAGGMDIDPGSFVTIESCTFYNNLTDANNTGGALYNRGNLTINHSTFDGNRAGSSRTGTGGGIFNTAVLTATNSTFINHVAPFGAGGAYRGSSASADATFENCTFHNNSSFDGAGLRAQNGKLTLKNSTIEGNSGHGVKFTNSATLNLYNTLIANNSSGDCVNSGGSLGANVNNLVADGNCSPAVSGDPLVGTLGNNGGPTQTIPLLPGSPAIEAGDGGTCLSSDQRGTARQDGDGDGTADCDIGAYEAPIIDPPSGFTATVVSDTQIDLSWTDNSAAPNNDAGFIIESPPGTVLHTTAADATSYSHGVACGITYDYTLKATNASGVSTAVTASAATPACPIPYTLTLTTSGIGQATQGGSGVYNSGETATLTATETDPEHVFSGWNGDCSGNTPNISLVMDDNKTCTATFTPVSYTLTLTTIGIGQVTQGGSGVYDSGETATLTAAETDPDHVFSGWSGDCSGNTPDISLVMDGDKTCAATFTTVDYTLGLGGSGHGRITATGGLDCAVSAGVTSGTCQARQTTTAITIGAVADPGQAFSEWTGACAGLPANASLALNQDSTCEAHFKEDRNLDGIPDERQDFIGALGNVTVLAESCPTCVVTQLEVNDPAQHAQPDTRHNFHAPLVGFRITGVASGGNLNVKIWYHDLNTPPTGWAYRKFGHLVPGDASSQAWFNHPAASFSATTWLGQPMVEASLDFTDGQLGDDSGVDGVIVDPGAPASPRGVLGFAPLEYRINEDAGSVNLIVTRTSGDDGALSVDYASADDTAVAGKDYQAVSGTLNWPAGDTSPRTIDVPVVNDAETELSEMFHVTLSGGDVDPANATATVTIGGVITLSPASVNLDEGGSATFTLTRGIDGAATVQYTTRDDSAVALGDYQPVSGELAWADGEAGSRSVSVNVLADSEGEAEERFELVFTGGLAQTATITISANSAPIPPSGPDPVDPEPVDSDPMEPTEPAQETPSDSGVDPAPAADPTESLTELDPTTTDLELLRETLPEGYELDTQTGDFIPPTGTQVKLKPDEVDIPPVIVTEPVVDMDCNLSVGCAGSSLTFLQMVRRVFEKEHLDEDFTPTQDPAGVLQIQGDEDVGEMSFSVVPNLEHVYRVNEGGLENMNVSLDETGFYHLSLENGLDFQVMPSPRDYQALIEVTLAETLYQGPKGEVLLTFGEAETNRRRGLARAVGIFNAHVEPPPAEYCVEVRPGERRCDFSLAPAQQRPGMHYLPRRRASQRETMRVVYPDGKSQEVYPTILEQETFTQTLQATYPEVESVQFYVDGSLAVVVAGVPYRLFPSFDLATEEAAPEDQPEVVLLGEDRIQYVLPWTDPDAEEVGSGKSDVDANQVKTTRRRGRAREILRFSLFIEPIPEEYCVRVQDKTRCDFQKLSK